MRVAPKTSTEWVLLDGVCVLWWTDDMSRDIYMRELTEDLMKRQKKSPEEAEEMERMCRLGVW